MAEADIGVIGLAVMGQNLALNMHDHGFTVSVFNRTTSKVDDFMEHAGKGSKIIPTHSIPEFVKSLKNPKRILLMVRAGDAVDEFIDLLRPHLSAGDILIDGGNSHFTDTNRRTEALKKEGILFVGAGVSGGEEGARHGPSIMPGGNKEAWPHVKAILQAISAKADSGEPCCDWVGKDGAGHYVKMVHNGIEYGDMQLIAECYQIMKDALKMNADELHDTFLQWNEGELSSYLIEITSHIFSHMDSDGKPLVDKILDVAQQKGTGKWVSVSALDLGVPLTLISEAVFSRCLSARKEERVRASAKLEGPHALFTEERRAFLEDIRKALYAAKVISYAQGFMLMRDASKEYNWEIQYGSVALMWRAGCIIRSKFLGNIKEAFDKTPDLECLLLDPFFKEVMTKGQDSLRRVVARSVEWGVPVPCLSTAISFYDGYRTGTLPSNLIQALRDYFGAHTYERIDRPRGEFFHTNWTGTGGKVSASSYSV